MRDGQFEDVFTNHVDRVFNHCLRRTGSIAEAEDLTAVVFLEAWRRRDQLLVVDALPWLLGVANNVLRNDWRSRRRYQAARRRFHGALPSPDPADRVVERVDAEVAIQRLRPVLDALPPRELEVVELVVGSELTVGQAAEALGLPTGTVKSRLARALKRIRESDEAPSVNPTVAQ